MRYELGSAIGGYVRWNTMFGKYMHNEKFSQLRTGDSVVHRSENGLFGETVHHYQDSSESIEGHQKLFNKIHGNGIPRTEQNGKLMEEPVWLVASRL